MVLIPGHNPPPTTVKVIKILDILIAALDSCGEKNKCLRGPALNHLFVLDNKSFGPKSGL
jgi:hypothetical protein